MRMASPSPVPGPSTAFGDCGSDTSQLITAEQLDDVSGADIVTRHHADLVVHEALRGWARLAFGCTGASCSTTRSSCGTTGTP